MKNTNNSGLKGISVIIPTFNRSKFLYSTLICLCNQTINTDLEYEIIIIDSGNDNTETIVKSFQNNGQRPIIYKSINKCKNRSLLRNSGAEIAKYSTLVFLDNDMLTPPDFLQRHFDEHQQNPHTVLLGCRKSLLHFDIVQIGEEALQTNFGILDQLPFYNDERLRVYNDNEPWRFVFSHTLSIDKEDFIKTGGFNVDFGEHWGFEDLELGFNLQLNGCKFKLIKDQFTFHQPHFEQSNKEQHEMSHNAELFIKLHNCFECELYESFYTSFDEFYPVLKKLQKDFVIPSKETQEKFDLILGCLFTSMENVPYNNMYLGAYNMKEDNCCKKVLIVDTFFKLPQIIQMSILTEAFRIGQNIYIENKEIEKINEFTRIAKAAGLIIEYKSEKDSIVFTLKEKDLSNIFIMLLPDIYEPEKRYVYSWLATYMMKNGNYVNIRDAKKTEKFCYDDFSLPEESQKLLENNFERCFGKTTLQFINSLSMILVDSTPSIPNSSRSFIIHDEDFLLKYNSLKFRSYPQANHFDESVFDCISFLSVLEDCEKYMSQNSVNAPKDSFCCFMENGYLEDGIDITLEAFADYVKCNKNAKLSIKIPDFNSFVNVVFTLHNDISKQSKLFGRNQKYLLDDINLKNKIKELNLQNNVELIYKNFSINEVVDFIGSHQTFILSSRACSVPPQVYISLLLDKRTIVGKHHFMLAWLQPFCSFIDSTAYEFAEEMKVPASCLNVPYVAFREDAKVLAENLSVDKEKITDEIKQNIAKEAYKIIDTYFVRK